MITVIGALTAGLGGIGSYMVTEAANDIGKKLEERKKKKEQESETEEKTE